MRASKLGVWALRGVSIDTQILSSANCAAKACQGHALSKHIHPTAVKWG